MPSFTENEIEDFDDYAIYSKMKIECICPKYGKRYVKNFCWIGRGIPRKFCPLCKGRF